MKRIDREIFEIENRLHVREALIRQTAAETKTRTVQSLKSPLAIGGTVVLGLLVAGALGRRQAIRRAARTVPVSREPKEQSKGFALGTLLMTGATWLIRSQFGGPAGLAQYVVHKFKKPPRREMRKSPQSDRRKPQGQIGKSP